MQHPFTLLETNSEQEMVLAAVEHLTKSIEEAVRERGVCLMGLSGGATPRLIYQHLGQQELPWQKVYLFLIDERYVPQGSGDSNANLLRTTLLSSAAIPEDHLTLPDTSLPIDACAAKYEDELHALLEDHGPPDIVSLGMGNDGHIASLFPPVPPEGNGDHLIVVTATERSGTRTRISTTLPVLRSAHRHFLFLRGPDKRATFETMLQSPEDPTRYPMQSILKEGRTVVIWTP